MLLLGRQLQIPQEILDAQRNGRLVIFAGAGVSKEEPSALPLFNGLVKEIANRDLTPAEKERPDQTLGALVDAGVDVHKAAVRILGRATSRPASGHRDLIGVFPNPHDLRIVTTNLDRHFTTAAREVDQLSDLEIYYAPALPPGNDFGGLVYLHGSIDNPYKRMVLTDRDFGSAYLTDAYAARFLERMFAEYTVLFVGYSHRDFMMEFLARGLSRHQKRFALACDDSPDAESFWRRLGINPIYYNKQHGPKSHDELWTGLARWARYSQAPTSEVEQRIREITATRPEFVSPTDTSYLEWQLRSVLGARFFKRHAAGPGWLVWLERQPEFQMLFDSGEGAGRIGWMLAEWFCECFVIGDAGALGLAAVERHKPHLHQALWHRIARTLAFAQDRAPLQLFGKWIGVLLSSWLPSYDCDSLGYLLSRLKLPEETNLMLLLFNFLSEPRVRVERGFGAESGKTAEEMAPRSLLYTAGDTLQLLEFIKASIPGNETALFCELLLIVEHHLLIGHRLLLAAGDASQAFDEASFRRAAIEPHEQNGSPLALDVLIDSAQVLLDWAAVEQPELLDPFLRRWTDSQAPLLRRLAVHAVARRADRSPDERLQWVLDNDLLFSLPEKHEVFRLLETAFADAAPLQQQAVVEAATDSMVTADSSPDRLPSDYERYNLLVWLSRCAPDAQAVSDALAEAASVNPEFEPREHPDLSYEVQVGFVPGPEENEVARVLAMRPTDLLEWVEACNGELPEIDPCDTRLRAVEAAANKSAMWAISIASELAQNGDTQPSLWGAAISGLHSAVKTPEEWDRILTLFMDAASARAERSLEIAWLLRDGVVSERGEIPLIQFPELLELAMSIWREHEFEPAEKWMDWMTAALNTTGGVLAGVVIEQIRRLRHHADEWEGLPRMYREALEEMLDETADSACYARVILSASLALIYDCDPEWATAHIVPLLDWEHDSEQAQQSWHGFLFASRLPEECLAALMPQYVGAASNLKAEAEGTVRIIDQLALHIGSILLFTSEDPYARNWIGKILLQASLELRVAIAENIGWLLGQVEDETRREEIWKARLELYWRKRLDGQLQGLSDEERAAMAEWVFPLATCLPSIAPLIEASEPPSSLDQAFWWHLEQQRAQIERFPTETARLAAHLLRGFPDAVEPWKLHKLDVVIAILEGAHADAEKARELREEALRAGLDPRAIAP